jgi:DNA-binding CsgD family transcriptional regulator
MAIAVDRARAGLCTCAPATALELWKGLPSARWTLIDHYERDGRRYLLAIRNDAPVTQLRELSAREQQVIALVARGRTNKLTAYELGLSEAAVSVALHSGMFKLGVRTRAELPGLLDASSGDADAPSAVLHK